MNRGLRVQLGSLGSARVVASAISAVWLVVAARQLSLDAYGDFTQVVSLSVILCATADLGLSLLLAHDVARWPDAGRGLVGKVVGLRLLWGIPACVALVGLYWVAAARPTALVAGLACVSMLATMVHQTISVGARGLGRVGPEATNEIASRAFVLGLGFLVLQAGGSVAWAVAVYAVADVLSACALSWFVGRRMPNRTSAPLGFSFRRVALLGLTIACMTLYARADIWLVGVLAGSADVARYAAPYRLFEGVLVVAATFAALTPPVVARATWSEVTGGLRRLVGGAVALTAAGAAVGIVFAEPMLDLLYGSRYAGTVPTFRILLTAAVPSAVVLVMLQATGLFDRRGTAVAVLGALVVNVGGNLLAIPHLGIEGAALMTLVTQSALAVALVAVFARSRTRVRTLEARVKHEGGVGHDGLVDEFLDESRTPMLIGD